MTIKGLTKIKNGVSLYLPFKESIMSLLQICDEFIVLLDEQTTDNTRTELEALQSDKIRIIDFDEGVEKFGIDFGDSDWIFCLMPDEVVHERYLSVIMSACDQEMESGIDTLRMEIVNFWGDYDHYQDGYGWRHSTRKIFRNKEGVFWKIMEYEAGKKSAARQKEIAARINKYTWVKPPELMQKTIIENPQIREFGDYLLAKEKNFDYGSLEFLALYTDTHPRVMYPRISKMDWHDSLQFRGGTRGDRPKHRHEMVINRFLTKMQRLFSGKKSTGLNETGML
jgi:hypothetical protein